MNIHETLRCLKAEVQLREMRGQELVSSDMDVHYLPAIRRLSRMKWSHAQELLTRYGLMQYVLKRTQFQNKLAPSESPVNYDAANIWGLINWIGGNRSGTQHELAYNRRGYGKPANQTLLNIQASRSLRQFISTGKSDETHLNTVPEARREQIRHSSEYAYVQLLIRQPQQAELGHQWLLRRSAGPGRLSLPDKRGSALRLAFRRSRDPIEQFNLAIHLACLGEIGHLEAIGWLQREHERDPFSQLLNQGPDHRHSLRVKQRSSKMRAR